jgi:serine/threonine protein kinase
MKPLGPQDPQTIGDYRLVGKLGEGGMGQVYVARSARGRTVALKLVLPELARQPEFRQRFRNEVDAARRTGGTWTAPVLDADLEAATPWVATGYVAGPSLHEVVASLHGPLPERSVLALANGLSRALADIHHAGLIHRDLKPSNVLVTIDGPRVIDFGIARAAGATADATGALTRTGSVVGSPGFMSPEQCRGEPLTPASDVFCLGSVLAFAATGRSPFGNPDSAMHVLMLRIIQDEKDLSGLPDRLRELITACLAPHPNARPTLDQLLAHTAEGDLWDDAGQSIRLGKQVPDPWLPSTLLAGLGRQAVGLLDSEEPSAAPPGWTPTAVVPGTTGGFGPPTTAGGAGASPHYAPTAFAGPPQPPPGPRPGPGPGGYAPTPAPPANPRRSSQPWLIGAGAAALILILVIAFSMSGGGGGDDNEGDTTAGADATAAATDGGGGGAQEDNGLINDEERTATGADNIHPVGADEPAKYTSGLSITLSQPQVVPESRLPYTLDPGEAAYFFTVTIENRSEEPIDAAFDPDVFAGEGGVEASSMSGLEFDSSLYGTVMPGRTLTTDFAYKVPADSGFLEAQYEAYAVTIWTLELL